MKERQNYSLPGYVLFEPFLESNLFLTYRGKSIKEDRPVLIKFPRSDTPAKSAEKIEFEYNLLRNLDIPGILKPFRLEVFGISKAMIMEDCGSITLSEYLEEPGPGISVILETAVKITAVLRDIHKNNIIHKDICPQNILINRKTGDIKIINFSIASVVKREFLQAVSADRLEGTLAFISPEQTGRVNHTVDFRSDFYSLGITFYLMLTGKLPFNYTDSMEMVHAHIAKIPLNPAELNPDIPAPISEIVLKLISKNPEDRYQSSDGLKYDLDKCMELIRNGKSVKSFTPGKKDIPDIFRIPEKIFGRKKEVRELISVFEKSSHPGASPVIVFVSGEPGIGKSLSAFYCIIDIEKHELQYCNAGHVEIIIVRKGRIIELKPNSPVMGYDINYKFNTSFLTLHEGDRIILYTDGIPEARNDESKLYGKDRFIASILIHSSDDLEKMVNQIFSDIGDFTGRSPRRDDITLLMAQILPAGF